MAEPAEQGDEEHSEAAAGGVCGRGQEGKWQSGPTQVSLSGRMHQDKDNEIIVP